MIDLSDNQPRPTLPLAAERHFFSFASDDDLQADGEKLHGSTAASGAGRVFPVRCAISESELATFQKEKKGKKKEKRGNFTFLCWQTVR